MEYDNTPAWTLAEVDSRRQMLCPLPERSWQSPHTTPLREGTPVWRNAGLVVGLILAFAWSLKSLAGL
jgi:hypothetical protein